PMIASETVLSSSAIAAKRAALNTFIAREATPKTAIAEAANSKDLPIDKRLSLAISTAEPISDAAEAILLNRRAPPAIAAKMTVLLLSTPKRSLTPSVINLKDSPVAVAIPRKIAEA